MMRMAADWARFGNILCVRPDNLGDVLMTTPAIRALKQAASGRRITLLTSRAGCRIAKHIPEIDDVLVFDPPWYRHAQQDGREEVGDIVDQLRERAFDAAIVFTVFSQNPLPNAMLCYLAGIPRVAAYCRENPYALVSEWVPDTEPLYGARHEVQRQLDLVTYLGAKPVSSALSLDVPADRGEAINAALRSIGVNPAAPWLLMHPGASEARRRYPAERFAEAARLLHDSLNTQVVLTGSTEERPLVESVAVGGGDGVFAAAGMFELADLIALIAMAPLLISNNTGPVHVAAAVQTPAVVLYAQTNPQHTPWQVAHRILSFDVPPGERSENVLVRYAGERFYPARVKLPVATEIVAAAAELLGHNPLHLESPATMPASIGTMATDSRSTSG